VVEVKQTRGINMDGKTKLLTADTEVLELLELAYGLLHTYAVVGNLLVGAVPEAGWRNHNEQDVGVAEKAVASEVSHWQR
jgi:hypothetical protein